MTGTVQPTFSNTNGDQQGVSATTPFPVTAIQGTGTSADQIQGNVAHDAVDAGNPVKTGGFASSTVPASVATADRVNTWLTLNGATVIASNTTTPNDAGSTSIVALMDLSGGSRALWVFPSYYDGTQTVRTRGDTNGAVSQPYAMTGSRWQYAAASGGITNTTAAVTLKAAAGASVRNYITGLQISADALGVATEVIINDGAGGTVLWRGKIQTAGLAAITIDFPVPLKGTANTLLEFATVTATVTGGVYVNAQGFTGA